MKHTFCIFAESCWEAIWWPTELPGPDGGLVHDFRGSRGKEDTGDAKKRILKHTKKHWTLASKKSFSWRVCGANSVTISTSWFSSTAHKGVFRFIIMLQNECISTKTQTCTHLWWLECYFSLVKVEWIWSRLPTPEKANKWINKSFCKSGEVV